jgi:hypothetical protein
VFVELLLRTGKRAFLPPLPPGEGWGEGECQAPFRRRTVYCGSHGH